MRGERPILRQVSAAFESEPLGGQPVTIGVRAQSRTRRSFVLEIAMWTPDDRRLVAVGTVSLVMFDIETGTAVEIPGGLRDAIETMNCEGVRS